MPRYSHTKKILLVLALWTLGSFLSMVPNSCRTETPVYAIVGQQLAIIRQGRYDSAMLELRFELRQVGIAQLPAPVTATGSELLATSPAPPIIVNEIVKIGLTAIQPYDDAHGSFTELNDIFALRNTPGLPISNVLPPIGLDDGRALYIIPIQPPSTGNIYRITATTTLEDGSTFTAATNIEINP